MFIINDDTYKSNAHYPFNWMVVNVEPYKFQVYLLCQRRRPFNEQNSNATIPCRMGCHVCSLFMLYIPS